MTTLTRSTVSAHVRQILPQIPGWCSPDKADRLIGAIFDLQSLSYDPLTCVEIGVFGGSSLIPQAFALSVLGSGRVWGIDPWEVQTALDGLRDEVHRAWWSKVPLSTIYESCRDRLFLYDLDPFARLVRARSEDVASLFTVIDLLHIDGNHSAIRSKSDVEAYLPKVRSGGYLFFDDLTWKDGGENTTRTAIELVLESCDHVDDVGDCGIYRKR